MSIFKSVLGKFTNSKIVSNFRFMNGYIPLFSSYGKKTYENLITRAAINAISANGAKLSPKHMIVKNGVVKPSDNSDLVKTLTLRPNRFMDSYTFFLKVLTQLHIKNNAFVLITGTSSKMELIPVDYSTAQAVESESELFIKFTLNDGKYLTVHYDELIHLRRHVNNGEVFGDSNKPLESTLDVLATVDDGLKNAINSSANLQGIIKTTAMVKDKDLIEQKESFIKSFKEDGSGIGALDMKFDFIPAKVEQKFINPVQAKSIEERVYKYYNINEDIVMSKYNEDSWNAFYESVIEPLSIQMSLEFTYKLFTPQQITRGNRIIFEANKMQYASNKTKISLVNTLMPLGLLTINEGREVFNMSPVEGGEKRLISLNYVDADQQNNYQVGGESNGENTNTETDE